MISKTLASYLKAARERAEFSQAAVAQILGYKNAQFISNWERGASAPPLEKLAILIKIYDLDRDEVIDIMLGDMREYLEANI